MSNNHKNTSQFQHTIERSIKMKLCDKEGQQFSLGLGFVVGL